MSNYENTRLPNADSYDCVIGNSFGSSTHANSVNKLLGDIAVDMADGRPIIADRTLVDAIPNGDQILAHTVEGDRTNIRAQGVGTWGTLVSAKQFMEEEGLGTALLIAQKHHLPRVKRQAIKLEIGCVLMGSMPDQFDRDSEQIWTRSKVLWTLFNGLGSLLLKKRGEL